MKNKIPKFKSEREEQSFWASHDSVDHVDWKKAKRVVFSNLRPSLKSISLRLPQSMLEELRLLANKRDVPYQSLLKMFLSERIERELRLRPHGA
ncbi:MAG: BrnA antitoxin family protein [Elusimicrobiota bacterium]